MRRYGFLVLLAFMGCMVLGAGGLASFMPAIIESPTLIEAAGDFKPVLTKLHETEATLAGVTTKFWLKPNPYQVCACYVKGPVSVCVCNRVPVGLCLETGL